MPKKKTNTSAPKDPVTAYAKAVVSLDEMAGPHVRHACERHVRDLTDGRDIFWDAAASNHVIDFFLDVLRLNGGEFEGKPFELLLWQQFIIGSLFGWKRADGYRRFRMAYIETGKGSGKSPLVAGIGIYMLCADKEARAEIYAAAQKKDQAKVLFRDAVAMVELSPALSSRLHLSGKTEKSNIAHPASGSFFRPISTEERGNGQSGPRPHCALLDEIHEHSTNAMVEMMRAGVKGRRQPMICLITNSGSDKTSVCYDYHDYAAQVCSGLFADDTFFGYVCAHDADEDPIKDDTCWKKSNPSLGITFQHTYLADQVRQARAIASKKNLVRRLNFCQWTDADVVWMGGQWWLDCAAPLDKEAYRGQPCYLGLDLAFTQDMCALAFVFPTGEQTYDAWVEFWTPKDTVADRAERDRVPALAGPWIEDGHVTATPGSVVKLAPIAARIGEALEAYDVQSLAYDRYRFKELDTHMADLGIEPPLIEHPQGFRRVEHSPLWMPGSVKALEDALIERRLRVHPNPILNWNVGSVVVRTDSEGNQVFDKKQRTRRIDGIVALTMGLGIASAKTEAEHVTEDLIVL